MRDRVEEYINQFMIYIENERRYSKQTVLAYSKDLIEFSDFLESSGDTDISKLMYQDFRLFLAFLNERGLARTTISRKLSSLRAFFKYALRMEWIDSNPMELVQYNVKKQQLPEFFYQDEMNEIFTAIEKSESSMQLMYSALVELLYATGMRVSELTNLTLQQVDYDMSLVRVIGKGDKERIIPVGDVALKSLTIYIQNLRPELVEKSIPEHASFVFLSKTGLQLSPTLVRNILNSIVKEAGLNLSIHPHKLRHTFATHLLNNGADMRSVQELLGHEDLSSTQIYTHVTKDRLRSTYLDVFPRAKRQSKEE
ncbi:tyrosine recombinase XerC [Aerococcaceae bacterium DSM 111021]|nr:tyrosine recombinase XerC [Aerococcaceae bacterium DSM 111021]